MQETVGFIGTGVMGASMAGHLLDAGHSLLVHNRTRHKADAIVDRGARWVDTPAEIAAEASAIFTMLGYPADVRQVYLGKDGLIDHAARGTLLCDFTTSSPQLAIAIAEAAADKGIDALDAPVSGGDIGAREAKLSIMCGGREEAFKLAEPFLNFLGSNVVYQGGPGAGQHTKMCNQIVVASQMMAVCEALQYAEAAELQPERVLKSVTSGAAGSWLLSNLAPRILDNDFEPGFYVEHFIKDMDIALDECRRFGISSPGLEASRKLYQRVADMGLARKGTQALILAYREQS